MRYHTTLADDHSAEKLVESMTMHKLASNIGERDWSSSNSLFIVLDGKLEMTRHDTSLLVIASGVPSKFKNFSGKVFEHGSQVDFE